MNAASTLFDREFRIRWKRLDLPGWEQATIRRRGGQFLLAGTVALEYAGEHWKFSYDVACSRAWKTESAHVTGGTAARAIDLVVEVNRHNWTVNQRAVAEVKGCADIDLAFSPMTNLLPIRRLALEVGQQGETNAAWLRFPELDLRPLPQLYTRLASNAYRYESLNGSFVCELHVNDAGVVIAYPGLWRATEEANGEEPVAAH
jgi:hypothetical protein